MEAARYSSWQEVVVSNGKGRRVVHYYLKGAGGRADLAVVGREKSSRHMSYVVPNQFVRSLIARPYFLQPSPSSSSSSLNSPPEAVSFKWRSRREVIDWLSSLVSERAFAIRFMFSLAAGKRHPVSKSRHPIGTVSSPSPDRFGVGEDYETADMLNFKFPSEKRKHPSREFQWLGALWLCRKRKRHYRSFCKNGVTISVHDFIFVMVEENKRRVGYVDDLYEDSRSNKNMVVVRWFHEVDELGIVLPPDANDREIFFSLCLQDFSVECIDGLAAVLSPQHFEQFQNEARHTSWRPFMCHRQIDNDDIKPFNITQLQGYWSQEIVRSMSFTSPFKLRIKRSRPNSSFSEHKSSDVSVSGSKRKHLSQAESGHDAETSSVDKTRPVCSKSGRNPANTLSESALPTKELSEHKFQQQFHAGTHVEILSQDSGIRGCWFRCVIIKRHRDKVKVRYQDIQDPDESGNLEEWILLSKIAGPDSLVIHSERPIVRPKPLQGVSVCHFHVGAIVDAWWHDGWWEGIVIREESMGRLHVYFPGENCSSTFSEAQLRQSHDWISNKWNAIEDRVDIANSLLSSIKDSPLLGSFKGNLTMQMVTNSLSAGGTASGGSSSDWEAGIPDLTKDYQFKLKWSSSKKRKHRREVNLNDASALKKRHRVTNSSSHQALEEHILCGSFVLPKSLTVDHENCKIGSDPLFSTPMALSNLVMSQ
ncbi:hypothetical protein ZIOFF_007950 [Zingiber officinale]|uniref:BAH domain-containing protein n=1 Tax=Zingiber officinale TaxID=94328 RepID=A0A8J5I2J0_ZINOF|nr:hypothetical protein ZIOFF_007950 [Zingiber officinale]